MVEVFMMTPKGSSQWNGPFTTKCVGEILTTGSFSGLNFCHFISFLTRTLGRHVVFWSFVSYYVREPLPFLTILMTAIPILLEPHFQQPAGCVTSSNPKPLSPCGQTPPPPPCDKRRLLQGFGLPARNFGGFVWVFLGRSSIDGLHGPFFHSGVISWWHVPWRRRVTDGFVDGDPEIWRRKPPSFQNTPKLTDLYGDLLFKSKEC